MARRTTGALAVLLTASLGAGVPVAQAAGTKPTLPERRAPGETLSPLRADASQADLRRVLATLDAGGEDRRRSGDAASTRTSSDASSLAPTTVPSVTSPGDGETVSGVLTVTATSSAPSVRFSLGGATVTVPVAAGVATGTVETYGLAGAHTLTAVDCDASGACSTDADSVTVTVANDAPALTAPAAGAVVGRDSFRVAATAPGGAVRFTVDGAPVATDSTAPYEADVSSEGLSYGAHTVGAWLCDGTGARCDTAHPADTRTISVERLTPRVTAVAPNPFSPGRDGRRDTTTVRYRLDRPQKVVLRVRTLGGSTVFGPRTLGTNLATGDHTYVWRGRNNSGGYVTSRRYTVELSTSAQVGDATLRGLATRTVRVDRVRPGLRDLTASPAKVFPYRDDYKDTTALRVRTSEPLAWLELRVHNGNGKRVRTVRRASLPVAGRKTFRWNGRYASGAMVPAGTYRFRFLAQDKAGNRRLSSAGSVTVSAKRLVKRTGTRTLGALGSAEGKIVGSCSDVFANGITDWSSGVGYYSNWYCVGYGTDDVAAGVHSWRLPSAIRYGTVRVHTYGHRALRGYPDTAAILYHDRSDDVTSTGRVLGSGLDWYRGPRVKASNFLVGGRRMRWSTVTTDSNWYDVKSYRVVWTYYVLR